MNIEQLKYFVVAARSGSFAEASRQAFVSPQAITKAVRILEAEIGVNLFEKERRPLRLTPFGEEFFHETTCVIWDFDKLKSLSTSTKTLVEDNKVLRIAVAGSELIGDILPPDFFLNFEDLNDSTELAIMHCSNNDCLRSLEQNQVDSAFIFGDPLSPHLQSIRVRTLVPALYIPKDHSLARLKTITPENSCGITLVCAPELYLYQEKLQRDLSAEGYQFKHKPASRYTRTQTNSSKRADEIVLGISPPSSTSLTKFVVRPLASKQKRGIPFCLIHHESSNHPLISALRKYAFGK